MSTLRATPFLFFKKKKSCQRAAKTSDNARPVVRFPLRVLCHWGTSAATLHEGLEGAEAEANQTLNLQLAQIRLRYENIRFGPRRLTEAENRQGALQFNNIHLGTEPPCTQKRITHLNREPTNCVYAPCDVTVPSDGGLGNIGVPDSATPLASEALPAPPANAARWRTSRTSGQGTPPERRQAEPEGSQRAQRQGPLEGGRGGERGEGAHSTKKQHKNMGCKE